MTNNLEGERKYLKSCHKEFWKTVFEAEFEYLLQHLSGCRDILSIGCGPAIIEKSLSKHGLNVTGLDISQNTLEQESDTFRVVLANAKSMPFKAYSFDAVIYVVSLQFIDDYRKSIEEAARVLQKNGVIIVMLLNPKSSFFKNRFNNRNSYIHKTKHMELSEIENVISALFNIQTEYFLGINKNSIFESRDADYASLYVIRGIKKA